MGGDRGNIRATAVPSDRQLLRIGPPAPTHLDSRSQAEAPQYPHSVGGEAGTYLGQALGLLVNAYVDALGQRVGGRETTDAAAYNGHSKAICTHGLLRRGLSTKGTFDTAACWRT
jgi:hypothetical protein